MKAITGAAPRRRDLLLDALDEALGGEAVRHARRRCAPPWRVDRPWPTMRDAGDAEQRRAAVLGVVDAPAETPERAPRQQRSDAHRDRARQLLAQQLLDHLDQPLADLQRDVAGEPVADDHVGVAAVDVARLDVADERAAARAFSSRCASRVSSLPLRLFLADRQQPDARRARCRAPPARRRCPSPRTAAGAAGRHSTLAPTSSSTAGRCARRNRRRERRPIDARQHAEGARAPPSPSRPVWPALKSAAASPRATSVGGHADRRARLAPQRRRRRFGHRRPRRARRRCGPERDRRAGWRASSASIAPRSADEQHAEIECRAAASAPSTMWRGAWSPPIASTAIQHRRVRVQRQGSGAGSRFWCQFVVDRALRSYSSSTARAWRPR